MKVFKKTISCILATSIACSMFATTVFAMGDTQDIQEEQTQSTQQVCSDEDLPQGVPYRETNLPSFDEDATEDVRNLAPDEYVQPEEGFAQDSQLQASMEDGSQVQSFANQIAGVQDAQYDPMVHDTQVWLNQNYGLGLVEDGKPGTAVSEGLVMAFQIELKKRYPEFPDATGYFGDTTLAYCPTLSVNSPSEDAIFIEIMQRGLYCKGYNPTATTGFYGEGTTAAISTLKKDAGLSNTDGSFAAPDVVKASLSSDAMKLVSGGDSRIREIQQYLNCHYEAYIGIGPCDGYYSRDTNKALIYALQAEEGLDTETANGTFGPTTKSLCPTLSVGDSRSNFVIIAQFSLYCNGYNSGAFNGCFSNSVLTAAQSFERFVALPTRNTIDLDVWMALLTSTGNPNRDGTAADCSAIMTPSKAKALHNDGYNTVGRYLTGTVGGTTSKALTRSEMQTIFNEGLNLFLIYQDAHGQNVSLDYFTYEQGVDDAWAAYNAASALGVPNDAMIYFAIDYDMMDSQVTNYAIPYFQGINSVKNSNCLFQYQIGIYSARNTCARVSNNGLACSSFVSDMSTGYSGNLGYSLPSNWAFDQVQEYTLGSSDGSFGVDKDVVSGRYAGFNNSGQPSNNENDAFFKELDELYNLAMSYTGGNIQRSNELTCQVLRYNSYNDPMWAATAGPIDDRFCSNARSILDTNALKYIYDYHEGTYLQTDHLAAVINAVIFNTTNFEYWIDSLDGVSNADSTVNDFAGWAGDLVTGADDMQKDIDMGVRSVQDAANYYIGNRANDGHCPFDDILQDVDGYNIGLSILNTGATLPSVMKTYYGINGLSYSRFTNFYINFTNLYTTGYSGTMQQNLYKRIMDCCLSTDDSLIFHCRTALIMGIGEKNGGHIAQSDTLQAAGEAFYNLILNEMSKENG